jgi:hypothetical protein
MEIKLTQLRMLAKQILFALYNGVRLVFVSLVLSYQ